jgi:hypothetical protein
MSIYTVLFVFQIQPRFHTLGRRHSQYMKYNNGNKYATLKFSSFRIKIHSDLIMCCMNQTSKTWSTTVIQSTNVQYSGSLSEWVLGVWRNVVPHLVRAKQSSWTAWPSRWGRYVPLKCQEMIIQWGSIICQKTGIFRNTTVRNSNKSRRHVDNFEVLGAV